MRTVKVVEVVSTKLKFNPREVIIIRAIGAGFPNKIIADTIGTSEQVIKNYTSRILKALQLKNRTQLAIWYAYNQAEFDKEYI